MSTEQRPSTEDTVITAPLAGNPSPHGAEWGAQPQQPKKKRSAKTIAIAVAVALGIAGAGAGAVYAASGSTSDTTQGPGGQGGGPGGQGGMGGGGMGLMNALHGEFVVSDGNGTYTTELMQNGDVTSISDSSVTVKSDDGYTKTYTIESSTDVSDIATGDEVTVIATESGSTATVDTISEAGTTGQNGQMGQAPPGQNGNSSSSSGN